MFNRIKQYRLAAGLTPQALSAMFKVPYATVLKWEKGEAVPPPWAEEKIISALKSKAKDDLARNRARFRLPRASTAKTPEEIAAANAARRWRNPERIDFSLAAPSCAPAASEAAKKPRPAPIIAAEADDNIVAEIEAAAPPPDISPEEIARSFVAAQERILAAARAAAADDD